MQDRNFDDLSEKFSQNIYGTTEGMVHQAILWDELEAILPTLGAGPRRVLDAGGRLEQNLQRTGASAAISISRRWSVPVRCAQLPRFDSGQRRRVVGAFPGDRRGSDGNPAVAGAGAERGGSGAQPVRADAGASDQRRRRGTALGGVANRSQGAAPVS